MTISLAQQQSVEYNFGQFQKGMYLDGQKEISQATIFFSNYIDDYYWNFAIDIRATASSISSVTENIEKTMNAMNRQPAFYITPWTEPLDLLIEKIRDKGYQKQFRDAWMFFEENSELNTSQDSPQSLTVKIVSNKAEIEDFMTVYEGVYGGEQTEDEPYGGLPPIYMTALRQSFSARDVQTFHLVGYKEDQPVAVATLVYADGWGGIYNAGTLATHRQQGIGTLLSRVCIDKWKEQGGHTLFLQTEVASKQEKFYTELGFKTAFIAECWAK